MTDTQNNAQKELEALRLLDDSNQKHLVALTELLTASLRMNAHNTPENRSNLCAAVLEFMERTYNASPEDDKLVSEMEQLGINDDGSDARAPWHAHNDAVDKMFSAIREVLQALFPHSQWHQ